jgi:hypothetical protein
MPGFKGKRKGRLTLTLYKKTFRYRLPVSPPRNEQKQLAAGRIQDFKLGGALIKIAQSGGRREHFWGISCQKSRFYAKKSYFFQFFFGPGAPPPGSTPALDYLATFAVSKMASYVFV